MEEFNNWRGSKAGIMNFSGRRFCSSLPSKMTYMNHLVHLENSKDFRYNTPLILLLGKLKFYSVTDISH